MLEDKKNEKFYVGSVTNIFSCILYIVDIYVGRGNCLFFEAYLRSYIEN